MFALKIALIRRKNDEITRLCGAGADINLCDNKGRNLLHEAINMSSAGADATFETEQLFIDLGIDINKKDNFDRVPLHYAFVKIEDRHETRDLINQVQQNNNFGFGMDNNASYNGFGGNSFGGGSFNRFNNNRGGYNPNLQQQAQLI